MGRVGGSSFNPLTAPGQMVYGGAGTPTGYTDLLAGLSGAGGGSTVLSSSAGAGGWHAGWTDGTPKAGSPSSFSVADGVWLRADFGAGKRIARFTLTQDQWANNAPDLDVALESSDDNVTWVRRWQRTVDGPAPTVRNDGSGWANPATNYQDYGTIDLPTPITARYWRLFAVDCGGGGNPWTIGQFSLWEVVTVGSGNQEVLDPPVTSPRLLAYDGPAGAPAWKAPGAANADTAATPAASVGIAVNDASATLVPTRTEHEALRAAAGTLEAEVNQLKALLRAFGILAS